MKIYIISNVEYEEKDKLTIEEDDLLVFLNHARSINYYKEHQNKVVYHRSKEESYGKVIEDVKNFYVFGDRENIPNNFILDLKKKYDWNYEIEEGKIRSCTTGYMVVKYFQHLHPNDEIILVNFGYEVSKSSYRCPWHNWKFEAKELEHFKHIFTTKFSDRSGILKILYKLNGWLGDNIYASAVVENMKATGKIAVNVSSPCNELWTNCQSLDKSITEENADYVITEKNIHPWHLNSPHMIPGTTDSVSYDLNIDIPCRFNHPIIYADLPKEKYFDFPYVILNTGWQNSAPTKKWLKSHWQKLVDLCPNIRFVEVGKSVNHPSFLSNTINIIDKTSRIELIHCVRDCIAVISPPSGVIHIAAAFNKPFISICGGREPGNIAGYSCGKSISVVGKFDCCKTSGCRKKGFKNEDGDKQCKNIYEDYFKEDCGMCMGYITAEYVKDVLKDLIPEYFN